MVFFAGVGAIGLTFAKAFAQRIAGTSASAREMDALRDEIAQLRAELDGVHTRLSDVEDIQNRLDFAERMLAQLRGKPALPGGG